MHSRKDGPGWNLISLPLQPQPAAAASVLSSVEGGYDIVYAWNPSSRSWLFYAPGLGHGTLKEMGPGQGYWVYASCDSVLTIG